MKIKVIKQFYFARNGVEVLEYAPGVHSVSKRCADVACAEGWAKKYPLQIKRKSKRKSDAEKI